MLRQRNAGTVRVGVCVWLAVILLAVGAGLIYTELVSAQESSTEAALSAPSLTAEAGEGEVALRWDAVSGAVRYELWVWTSAAGWQDIGGDNLTGTTYSHTGLTAGTTYHYAARALNGSGEASEWSAYAAVTIAATQSTTAPATPNAHSGSAADTHSDSDSNAHSDSNSNADCDADIDADCAGLGALRAGFDRGGGRGRGYGRVALGCGVGRGAL